MTTPFNPSSTPPNSDARPTTELTEEQARNKAAAERYAEVSLKSRPLPEGYDPNQRATMGQAIKTIQLEDFTQVHRTPCFRQAGLALVGGGAIMGGFRYIFGAPVPKATNFAVYSGLALSVVSYEYCQYQRRVEKGNLKRVVEVYTKKQAGQKKMEHEKGTPPQQQQQPPSPPPQEAPIAAGKSWYKFW